jgi:Protein of unknown function N-terminus (DUF3323)
MVRSGLHSDVPRTWHRGWDLSGQAQKRLRWPQGRAEFPSGRARTEVDVQGPQGQQDAADSGQGSQAGGSPAAPTRYRWLPAFADQACGDPHALDDGRRLATYVLRGLACLDEPPPAAAAERRCDALSTSVLVVGLRPTGASPAATLP